MVSGSSSLSIGLLLSGGLDSAILLGHLLGQGQRVQPFYIRSHLRWEAAELQAVRQFLAAVARPGLANLVVLDLPLADLYQDRHWSLSGFGVPDADTPDEAVYLPGRNPLLVIKAALWCQMHGIGQLALALLASNPFADATAKFFDSFQQSLTLAAETPIKLLRPLAHLHKTEVMHLGCGLPLELTFSCLAPVDGLHCGRCNKCAERQAAFLQAQMKDPTRYAFDGRAVEVR